MDAVGLRYIYSCLHSVFPNQTHCVQQKTHAEWISFFFIIFRKCYFQVFQTLHHLHPCFTWANCVFLTFALLPSAVGTDWCTWCKQFEHNEDLPAKTILPWPKWCLKTPRGTSSQNGRDRRKQSFVSLWTDPLLFASFFSSSFHTVQTKQPPRLVSGVVFLLFLSESKLLKPVNFPVCSHPPEKLKPIGGQSSSSGIADMFNTHHMCPHIQIFSIISISAIA